MTRLESLHADPPTRTIRSLGDSPVDRYELHEAIGSGATATVWRAHDTETGQEVAIKRFHGQLLDDIEGRQRFDDEAAVASLVSHPNIVSVLDRISTDDEFWLVFPYVAGSTLAERLVNRPPLAAREAARISVEIADALATVHAAGLVHRDVKPGNILLGADGHARLLDFGISRSVTDETAQRRTATGAGLAIGTLPYMAPEQLAAHAPTPASDVYALGAVLYEMLSGSRPYEAASALAMAEAQRTPPPAVGDAPGALAGLAAAALSYDPAARPDANQFARAASGWLDGRKEPAAITVLVPAAMAVVGRATPAPPVGSPWLRQILVATMAALVVAIAVIGASSLPQATVNPSLSSSLEPVQAEGGVQAESEVQRGGPTVGGADDAVAAARDEARGSTDRPDRERGADLKPGVDDHKGKAKGHEKDNGAGRDKGGDRRPSRASSDG